jgi:hypothetical protein
MIETLKEWWSGKMPRRNQWSIFQAFFGLNVFYILSFTFENTIIDVYSPDTATLLSSGCAGVAALMILTSTQVIRSNPIKWGSSMTLKVVLWIMLPAFMIYGQRAPIWVLWWGGINVLLLLSTWRRPPRRKTDPIIISQSDLDRFGIKDIEHGIEPAITKGSLAKKAWQSERIILLSISASFFASSLHLLPEPLIYIITTLFLFIWLNSPLLLPPGASFNVFLAFAVRIFQSLISYNLEFLLSAFFVRDRIAQMGTIVEWTFWAPLLASSALAASLPLSFLGIPIDTIDSFIDDDRYWIYLWRTALLSFVATFFHGLYYWSATLVPLLKQVS